MTTIAYRDGVLAGDSRTSCGNHIIPGAYRKVFKMPDGSLLGWCGEYGLSLRMLQALLQDEEVPTFQTGNANVIRVTPKGRIEVYEGDGIWLPHTGKVGAWGSGRSVAYGAMEHGASAVEAVRTAKKYDDGTGGPVRAVRLDK